MSILLKVQYKVRRLLSAELCEKDSAELKIKDRCFKHYTILCGALVFISNLHFLKEQEDLELKIHHFYFLISFFTVFVVPVLLTKGKRTAALLLYFASLYFEQYLEIVIANQIFIVIANLCLGCAFICFLYQTVGGIIFGFCTQISTFLFTGFVFMAQSTGDIIFTQDHFYQQFVTIIPRIVGVGLVNGIDLYLKYQRVQELKRLHQEVILISKTRSTFFASMSHELRNPLNALLGSIELLEGSENAYAYDEEIMTTAKVCGETLLNLIGNLLDVSKIEAKKLELLTAPAYLRENLDKIVKMASATAQQKGLYVKLKIDPLVPECLMYDSQKLAQILINIQGNAIKFTDRGGITIKAEWFPIEKEEEIQYNLLKQLTISDRKLFFENCDEFEENEEIPPRMMTNYSWTPEFTSSRQIMTDRKQSFLPFLSERVINDSNLFSPKNHSLNSSLTQFDMNEGVLPPIPVADQGILKIQIIDTGIGINKENIKKLFKPFAQEDSSISQNFGGTGLGLWISKNIAQLMGGDIRIESRVKSGTNFIIAIPMSLPKDSDEENWDSDLEFRGLKTLYVEDQPYNRQIMRGMLEREKINVHMATNGKEGFEAYYQNKKAFQTKATTLFGLIITDLRMSVMSGKAMIAKIRKFEKTNNLDPVPILVVTGDPSDKEKFECLNVLEVNAFMNKPIKLNALLTNIRKALYSAELASPGRRNQEERKSFNLEESVKLEREILFIDDDYLSSNVLSRLLQKNNYKTKNCYVLKDGIEYYKQNFLQIGLIFIDSHLPDGLGRTGAKTIRKFEKKHKLEKVPIISLSGDSEQIQKHEYKSVEIEGFLTKPVQKNQLLLTAIKNIIK
jgi:signal transduction histidine kinase/response regulator RpfG family c-di-GMP phosphodiesterase